MLGAANFDIDGKRLFQGHVIQVSTVVWAILPFKYISTLQVPQGSGHGANGGHLKKKKNLTETILKQDIKRANDTKSACCATL